LCLIWRAGLNRASAGFFCITARCQHQTAPQQQSHQRQKPH